MWFRPLVATHLKDRKIQTLGDLVDFCNRHGGSWWRAVPRIGPSHAEHIVAWLRRHESTLGDTLITDVDRTDPFRAVDADLIEVGDAQALLAPLERMVLTKDLSGAPGVNRAQSFSYIARAMTWTRSAGISICIATSRRHCGRTPRNLSASCCGRSLCGTNRSARSLSTTVRHTRIF
jgi:hypothetical protein